MAAVTSSNLLQRLPPFNNGIVLIEPSQGVPDIIREVLDAHEAFAEDYDGIYEFFDTGEDVGTSQLLFEYLKDNISYKVESDERQTTKSPSALVALGYGDCKHYAGFIAGVLNAIERNTGRKIKWAYRFASYQLLNKEPGHVFVVINPDTQNEIWIDPVLGSWDERLNPYSHIDKKIKTMALYRISGVGGKQAVNKDGEVVEVEDIPEDIPVLPDNDPSPDDGDLSPELINAINLLLNYNVIDVDGNINNELILVYSGSLPAYEYQSIVDAVGLVQSTQIAGFFQTIFRGVKKVTLSIPRGAYLSIVALNVFGTGSKLKEATRDEAGANKVRNVWYKLGGDWNVLQQAIKNGSGRARILGTSVGAAAAALPAWVLAATAIIAAMTPVITSILKSKQAAGTLDPYFSQNMSNDDLKALGLNDNGSSGSSIQDFLKNNLVWVALGGGALFYWYKTKKRR